MKRSSSAKRDKEGRLALVSPCAEKMKKFKEQIEDEDCEDVTPNIDQDTAEQLILYMKRTESAK